MPAYDRVLVIADIEGSSRCPDYRASAFLTPTWRRACLGMTRDVDAVVQALFAAGVRAVTVKDFHRTGYNLLPERIDPRARVLCGYHDGPLPGFREPPDAQAVLFLGMHAAAGTDGFLAHTLTSRLAALKVNGAPLPEVALFAAALAPWEVRPIFFSGCPVACAQARRTLPGIHTFGIDKPLPAAFDVAAWRTALAAAAVRALDNTAVPPHRPTGPFETRVVMRDGEAVARKLARRWGLERRGAVLRWQSADIHDLYRRLVRLCYLSPFLLRVLGPALALHRLQGRLGRAWVRRAAP